ncbi:amidase [Siccirubricoccus sp. KC 17139]|uniref:Amidase n=1 Tax=Siccirubricoccus soli TaxID=2899147 RepID=A0ABT1D1Y5_9PROT|nr:amidase [Siccirubricoccus soli]MCO6415035.1 amidase [Siccirubricoccus soli]MCP2681166.1 amidase [Siccirubricoccus soli]
MTDLVQNPGGVQELGAAMARGELTADALVRRCLERIAAVDRQVRAWVSVQPELALGAAQALDAERRAGRVRGPLHGIPVGVKDVIDVAGLPTRANSPSRADAAPATADATVVAHLRAAGAIILGKLHTTEYAYYESLPPTRNPYDLTRTAGGSSAGSGAAIASGTVPLALGTQTAGSVNRPAAYTGVAAFKPSTLAIGGTGVVPLAPSFDTVGAFGAGAADAALLAAGYAADHLHLRSPAPATPRLVVLEDAMVAAKTAPGTAAALDALAERFAEAKLPLRRAMAPVPLEVLLATHRTVLLAELGRTHKRLPTDRIAPRLAQDIEAGLSILDTEYHAALAALAGYRQAFWSAFGPDELLLLPAAPDVAPEASTTGDPSFVIPTTALGGPVATVRAGMDGALPVGALLFGAPGADTRLAGFLLSETGAALGL